MTFTVEYETRSRSGKDALLEEATALLMTALQGVKLTGSGEDSVHCPQHPLYEAYHALLTVQFVKGQLSKLAHQKENMTRADYQCAADELRDKKAGHLFYWCDLAGHKPRSWCPCCQRRIY